MKPILFLVPSDSMSEAELAQYAAEHPDIDFCPSNTDILQDLVARRIHADTKIVAARANSAARIRKWYPHLTVVEITFTGYDILHAINLTAYVGKTIAVVTTNSISMDLNILEDVCQIKILNYLSTPVERFSLAIQDAVSQGADMILGGALATRAARKLGYPTSTLKLGVESMYRTLNEIRQIEQAVEMEMSRQAYTQTLMNHIQEGVLSLDADNRVTSVNAIAEGILGLHASAIVGRPIAQVFPADEGLLDLSGHVTNAMITLDGNDFLYNKHPISVQDRVFGAIISFQETKKIQHMERTIRRQSLVKHHRAPYTFDQIIGGSTKLTAAVIKAKNYARTPFSVLITGETGTGKEVFAQSIHNASPQAGGAFVAANCAALPKSLLESELFGYVEGAFTGASRKGKAGLFETAHKGTLFLDEISEMDLENQGALLRVMQEKYVVRLGSNAIIPVEVRIIAATNKNLKQMVAEGKFREDLYYRLNVLTLALPPIRERSADILQFLQTFLQRDAPHMGKFVIAPEAEEMLTGYSWPGNVREIENVSHRIVANAQTPYLSGSLLHDILYEEPWSAQPAGAASESRRPLKEEIQLQAVTEALRACNGNIEQAAKHIGISRTTLWRRMKKFGLTPEA